MKNSGKYDVVPNKVNFSQEKARIMTRDQLYQREKELSRLLKKNKRDAQDVVEVDGVNLPKYLVQEFKNVKRANNKKREELRGTIAPDLVGMSKPEQATYYADKNIAPTPDEVSNPYDYPDRLDEEITEKYFSDVLYFDNYLKALSDPVYQGIYSEVEEILTRLQDIPRAIREIMESPDVEKNIDYLYPSKDMTQTAKKIQEVVSYWRRMEAKYLR